VHGFENGEAESFVEAWKNEGAAMLPDGLESRLVEVTEEVDGLGDSEGLAELPEVGGPLGGGVAGEGEVPGFLLRLLAVFAVADQQAFVVLVGPVVGGVEEVVFSVEGGGEAAHFDAVEAAVEGQVGVEDLLLGQVVVAAEALDAKLGVGLDEVGLLDGEAEAALPVGHLLGGEHLGKVLVKAIDQEADLGHVGIVEGGVAEGGVMDVGGDRAEDVRNVFGEPPASPQGGGT